MGRRGVKPEQSVFESLLEQARVTNRLLAALLRQHLTQTGVIEVLKSTRLTSREIGELLGTSSAVVTVTQMRIRKRSEQKEQTNAESEEPQVAEDGVREVRERE